MSFSKIPTEILFEICKNFGDDTEVATKRNLVNVARVNKDCCEVALEVMYERVTCHDKTIAPMLRQLFRRQHPFARIKQISFGDLPFNLQTRIHIHPDVQARLLDAIDRFTITEAQRIHLRKGIAKGSRCALIETILRLTPNIEELDAIGHSQEEDGSEIGCPDPYISSQSETVYPQWFPAVAQLRKLQMAEIAMWFAKATQADDFLRNASIRSLRITAPDEPIITDRDFRFVNNHSLTNLHIQSFGNLSWVPRLLKGCMSLRSLTIYSDRNPAVIGWNGSHRGDLVKISRLGLEAILHALENCKRTLRYLHVPASCNSVMAREKILTQDALGGFDTLEDLVMPAHAFFNGDGRDTKVSLRLPTSLKRLCLTHPSKEVRLALSQRKSSLDTLAKMMVQRVPGNPFLEELQILHWNTDIDTLDLYVFVQSELETEENSESGDGSSGLAKWRQGEGLRSWYQRAHDIGNYA
ncbi:hypothetical protein K491DRAFT_722823 [Lophiostoma macrostomum CBS 122681]|uniref:F-box domain-containing protein n=1 Tax=Lophiostoma macrostomum CBS 122681 TaxID=1314788 RepID=A0A6A6SKK7_9PLEO|nr:hypothetical protein K491DRAFT_722823 [Lophiostoma macrostomum CBS 122681]